MLHMLVLVSVSLKEVKDYVSHVVWLVCMCVCTVTHTNIMMAQLNLGYILKTVCTCGPVYKGYVTPMYICHQYTCVSLHCGLQSHPHDLIGHDLFALI